MKSRTLYFAPGRAAPGMLLAKAVVDHDGNTLLATATELTSQLLERLIRRRVETICVLLADARDEQTIEAELIAALGRVEHIFRGPGSTARAALHAAIVDFRRECTQ